MYRLAVPHEDLLPFVEHYWAVSVSPGEVVDLSVDAYVDARADLVFNLGDPYLRSTIGRRPARFAASNLDAQRTVPIRIVQRGAAATVGVRFRAGGLAPFLRQPAAAFTNRTPGIMEVFGGDAMLLESRLSECRADVGAQGTLIDAFLRERLVLDDSWAAFDRLRREIEDNGGLVPVEELARASGLSSRSLVRLFARHLGIRPKLYARIARFQKALRLLMHDAKIALGTVSTECGYFDQSHFVKDFRRFTGGVPRGYKGYYPPQGPSDFAPNVVRFLQDDRER
jgi:AraC-like DNA-binding protein